MINMIVRIYTDADVEPGRPDRTLMTSYGFVCGSLHSRADDDRAATW